MEQPRNLKHNRNRWDIDKVRYQLEKPPSPQRELRSVGELLPEIMASLDYPRNENLSVLCSSWEKLAGHQIAVHSQPGFIKDRILHVFVNHPGWIAELQRMKRPLLQKIQQHYKEMNIRQLRFIYNPETKNQ